MAQDQIKESDREKALLLGQIQDAQARAGAQAEVVKTTEKEMSMLREDRDTTIGTMAVKEEELANLSAAFKESEERARRELSLAQDQIRQLETSKIAAQEEIKRLAAEAAQSSQLKKDLEKAKEQATKDLSDMTETCQGKVNEMQRELGNFRARAAREKEQLLGQIQDAQARACSELEAVKIAHTALVREQHEQENRHAKEMSNLREDSGKEIEVLEAKIRGLQKKIDTDGTKMKIEKDALQASLYALHSDRDRATEGLERALADLQNVNKKLQNKMKTDGAQMKTEIKKLNAALDASKGAREQDVEKLERALVNVRDKKEQEIAALSEKHREQMALERAMASDRLKALDDACKKQMSEAAAAFAIKASKLTEQTRDVKTAAANEMAGLKARNETEKEKVKGLQAQIKAAQSKEKGLLEEHARALHAAKTREHENMQKIGSLNSQHSKIEAALKTSNQRLSYSEMQHSQAQDDRAQLQTKLINTQELLDESVAKCLELNDIVKKKDRDLADMPQELETVKHDFAAERESKHRLQTQATEFQAQILTLEQSWQEAASQTEVFRNKLSETEVAHQKKLLDMEDDCRSKVRGMEEACKVSHVREPGLSKIKVNCGEGGDGGQIRFSGANC